jgi:hypothetical protein
MIRRPEDLPQKALFRAKPNGSKRANSVNSIFFFEDKRLFMEDYQIFKEKKNKTHHNYLSTY